MKATRALIASVLFVSGVANATPITSIVATAPTSPGQLTTLGGYSMTDFTDPRLGAEPADVATSAEGDVDFTGKNGVALPSSGPFGPLMRVGDQTNSGANTNADPNETWWSGSDEGFYYADFGFNWIELIMPANTVAFSLTMDSSTAANAWIVAIDNNGVGTNTLGETFAAGSITQANDVDFDITLRNGVAESYGFHAANGGTSGACNTITKVIIDPSQAWGIGDFAISTDANACTSVPEPAPLAIFGLGLLGLFCTRVLRREPAHLAA